MIPLNIRSQSLRATIPIATVVLGLAQAEAGSIFLSGHDAIWHAGLGGNFGGAKTLAVTGIEYARNGSPKPFLFIESKTVPVPGGNAHEAPFLVSALGYAATDFVVADLADLSALSDFRLALDNYSAIVVSSDHGGMLTAGELGFLNAQSADIIDYLNDGGGLAAFSESNAAGLVGATPRFGYLPFLVSSVDFSIPESGNTVTAFGAGLGLTDGDVNGNFSHNYFQPVSGMLAVDLLNGDPNRILSLAFRGTGITPGGVVPEGSTIVSGLAVSLAAVGWVWCRSRR